jgi:DNA invertase Pin-like site-specific DNA recombinase
MLEALLYSLRPGDVVLVYKVDRVARSLIDLLRILDRITRAGAVFKSLTEPLETGTPVGRMMLQLLGAVAEFERAVILERCEAGRAAARERGVRFGRPPALDEATVRQMAASGLHLKAAARATGVAPSTLRHAALRCGIRFAIDGRSAVAHSARRAQRSDHGPSEPG